MGEVALRLCKSAGPHHSRQLVAQHVQEIMTVLAVSWTPRESTVPCSLPKERDPGPSS